MSRFNCKFCGAKLIICDDEHLAWKCGAEFDDENGILRSIECVNREAELKRLEEEENG